MKLDYFTQPAQNISRIFKEQYCYREDIGIIKVTNSKLAKSAQRMLFGVYLFNSEHACLIDYYNRMIARAALEQAIIKLNKINEDFSYLKTETPEYFV